MCTAISYMSKEHYFGRNLDLEYSYQESVTITPRKYEFIFRNTRPLASHSGIIGIATIVDDYPLYYDATNEYGLSIAALNFPNNACYFSECAEKENIASFELIPYLLSQCHNVAEAKELLKDVNILNISFNKQYSLSPLHWMLSDNAQSIVIESVSEGLKIYDNPVSVLTNNPPFPFHLNNLTHYMNLTPEMPQNRFSDKIALTPISNGIGCFGLPGDPSSASRFVKASYVKLNSVDDGSEYGAVSQFFHILDSVAQQAGTVKINNAYEKTVYSSCCNTERCIYYYKTYSNNQITAVNMFSENLDTDKLISYPLIWRQSINYINKKALR